MDKPGNQCGGVWPDTVLDRYVCNGAAFESSAPYNALDTNRCSSSITRYNTGATGWAYVSPSNSGNLARSVRYNPTVIDVDARTWQGLAAGWVRNCGEPNNGLNHAVLVVGWVDNVPMSNGQTWSFWYIKNSCES